MRFDNPLFLENNDCTLAQAVTLSGGGNCLVGADLSAMGRSAAPKIGTALQSIADKSAPTV